MAEDEQGRAPSHRKIGRQIVLPLSKAFEIAWKGIRIRLWRSVITMSGIVLAIAFLTSVWISNGFTDALNKVEPDHELYPLVQAALEAEAIASGGVAIRCSVVEGERETVRSGITPATSIRDSLEGMKIVQSELVPAQARAVAEHLSAPPGARPDAVIFVGLPAALSGSEVARAVEEFVREGGFVLFYGVSGTTGGEGAEELAELLPATAGEGTFRVGDGSQVLSGEVHARWDVQPQTVLRETAGAPAAEPLATLGSRTVVWGRKLGEGAIAWYPVAEESDAEANHLSWFVRGYGVDSLELVDKRDSLVVRLLAYGRPKKFTTETGDSRGIWLVGLSLMVCVVGITNAMLMSVTERYREIGTMKCLGALDKFIVKLFLIESSLQGIAGSLLGALIGFALAFLRALFAFHVTDPETGKSYWLATRFLPVAQLSLWLVIALVTGVVLTVVAAIYPAVRAARMEPVQAMRAEA